MQFDELDCYILEKILKSKKTSTYRIAKSYPWDDIPRIFFPESAEDAFYRNKTGLIIARLKKMAEYGIINIIKEKHKNVYEVISQNTMIRKHKFPHGYRYGLFIKNKKWIILEI